MGLEWLNISLLLLLGMIIGICLFQLYIQLIRKLNKVTFMNYRMEFEFLSNQISEIKTVEELRLLQLEFDKLYHKVITHCKTEDMEDEFRYAYTLIIDKMMEVYTQEMEISEYKVVKFGEVSPDLGGLALN